MNEIKKGQEAPLFNVVNQSGNPVSLGDFNGSKNVVLYFYPKDDTPGCTIEANQFTSLLDEFNNSDTVILGVSKDNCESHQAFIDKYKLGIDLLSDETGELCEKYGAWQEKEKNGEKKMGIVRSTFIINKKGIVEEAMYAVTADGHANEVLEIIRKLNK